LSLASSSVSEVSSEAEALESGVDFVEAFSSGCWSVLERPWRAARGGVAMGDLPVTRIERGFFSCPLILGVMGRAVVILRELLAALEIWS